MLTAVDDKLCESKKVAHLVALLYL